MKNLLTILMFSIFIWGCNDDNSLIEPNVGNNNQNTNGGSTVLTLDLISPLNTTTGYCNIDFVWSLSQSNITSVIDIATDEQFDNVIFTDTIVDTTFTLMQNLQPNRTYYWKIKADNLIKTDSFTVQNMADLADFIGTFPATAHHYVPWGGPEDTTWTTTVQIDFTADELPQLSVGSATIIPWNFVSGTSCDVLKYERNNFPTDMGFIEVELNLANRTFMFRRYVDSWHFTIYTEYTGSID